MSLSNEDIPSVAQNRNIIDVEFSPREIYPKDITEFRPNMILDSRHLYYTFLSSSYYFFERTSQIATSNCLIITKPAQIPSLSVSQHFLNLFLLIICHAPILHSRGIPSNEKQLFFYLCFPCLQLFIPITPRNKLIIFTNVLKKRFLLCYKPIRDILERVRVFTALCYIITYLLGFEVIRDMSLIPWVFFNCFNTHLLGLEVVRNKKK